MSLFNSIFRFSFFCLLPLLLMSGCRRESTEIQTGDLLFVALPLDYTVEADTASMASAIAAATGDEAKLNYIHVAILEVSGDTTFVIDATLKRGVDRYPLDTMKEEFRLRGGDYPVFVVKRMKDNKRAAEWVAGAKQYVGRGYDVAFLPDNDEQYCSELVWNSYTDADGRHLMTEAPMNFRAADGSFPPYWVWLFSKIGMPIPQDVPGTNPNDMAKEPGLKTVCKL